MVSFSTKLKNSLRFASKERNQFFLIKDDFLSLLVNNNNIFDKESIASFVVLEGTLNNIFKMDL